MMNLSRMAAAFILAATPLLALAEVPPQAKDCAACHGVDGNSDSALWPNLAGQHAEYLALQLRAFRDGERYNPAMTPYVSDLTDDDIESLADFYASQAPVVAANGDSDLVHRGQQLAGSCSACHGYAGVPVANRWPVLAGQHAAYLQQQLNRYKIGERIHPLMQAAVGGIDAVNFAALAAYYSQLER